MSEADFEREANKLLRDLGLPSDTLNFFDSDTAKTSNWKSTLKAPSPPKARRVSSTGTTTQFQRRQRERAATATANGAPSSIKRPDRSSIPFRNPPLSQGETTNSSTNTNRASAKNRFSTPPGPSSIPVSSSSSIRTKSQSPPPQNVPDQPPASGPAAPQASSTPTKRQVHRPAPRAPPSGYQSAKFRRASTPSRTTRSVSPTGGPAQKSSTAATTTSQSQGSGIPVFNRRLSPSAAAPISQPTAPSTISNSTINPGGVANSNKPSHLQKPATKATVSSKSVSRPAPGPVVSAVANTNTKSSTSYSPSVNGSAAVNSEVHAYESIDGSLVSRSTTKSTSPPVKQSMLKKPSSTLTPPKHSEINRRLSAPEKGHDGRTPESQKATNEKGGSKADHKQLLQLLSASTKTSMAHNGKQTSKPTTTDTKAAATAGTSTSTTSSKPVRPERTSVLSYSRIPISSSISSSSSSKTVPPTSQSSSASSEAKSATFGAAAASTTTTTTGAGGSSRIPQPGGGGFARGGTWASSSGSSRIRQHQQQQQQRQEQQQKVQEKPQEKPLGEVGGGDSSIVTTYDSLSPSDLDAILKKDDSFLLKENDRPPQKADANVSGVYDRLTPKEIMMILQDEDVSKDKARGEKSVELKQNGVTVDTVAVASSTDPMEHLYARVNKHRRHSDGQGAPENRQSLTSPISDPGTADQTVKGKRHSADETVRSDSRGSSNPPSRSSSHDHEVRSSEKLNGNVQQNGRSVSSTGSTATGTTTTVSSPESLTDRQTPDSDERRSKISVSWPKQSVDATSTNTMNTMATTTVQALQTLVEVMTPQPSPVKSDAKKFNYEDESSGTTPWYLLDTEENESTGSSHPLSPDLSSELLSMTTSPMSLQQAGTIVNGEAKIIGKKAGRRYSDTATKPQVEPIAHAQQSSPGSKGGSSGASNKVSERRRNSGQMNDSSRKSSSASNPPSTDSPPVSSSRKTSSSGQASQSSHGNHGNNLTVKDQPNWPGQKRKTSPDPPPPISRTLSSPEHDYAILDPEFNEEFFGKSFTISLTKQLLRSDTIGCTSLST